MEFIQENIIANFNYWVYVILMMIGLFAMIAKNNLIKKLVGMSIFQTAIILFYVSIGVKADANIPILSSQDVPHSEEEAAHMQTLDVKKYANPIPHVLMLTAIVVGVSTLGVALSIAQRVHHHYDTLEEDEILAKVQQGSDG